MEGLNEELKLARLYFMQIGGILSPYLSWLLVWLADSLKKELSRVSF